MTKQKRPSLGLEAAKKRLEEAVKLVSSRPILERKPSTTMCKICKIEVEMDLWYHYPQACGLFYSCGCRSEHTKTKNVWTSKDGTKLEVEDNE